VTTASRVGVVGGAAQHRTPGLDPDDAGQRTVGAVQRTDEGDPVTHDDGLASELACLHGRHGLPSGAVADEAPEASAVHRHDPADDRPVVGRPLLGART
jgi:hypothetical protein